MPRNALFTREEIVREAFGLVREKGFSALSARELGKALGSSSRPIFTVFKDMGEVQKEVRKAAWHCFDDYMADVTDYTPAFKEYGRRLIRFAKEDKFLFEMLFMDRGAGQNPMDSMATVCTDAIKIAYGLTHEEVMTLVGMCWFFACGLATLSNTGAIDYSEEIIDELISRQFMSNLYFMKSGKEFHAEAPHLRGEESITLKLDL